MGQFGRFLRGLENVQKPRRRIQNGGCAELITQFRRHMTSLLYCADRKRKQFSTDHVPSRFHWHSLHAFGYKW